MSGELDPSADRFPPSRWIEGVFASKMTDGGLAADSFDPLATLRKLDAGDQSLEELNRAEQGTDPGVIYKNILLGRLVELAEDRSLHVGGFLSLLERQATELGEPEETRHEQFMGIWDLFVAIAKDEDLMRFLRDRPNNY